MAKLGIVFGDTFNEQFAQVRVGNRLKIFYLILGGVGLMIWGRLAQLQLVNGAENRIRSEENRMEVVTIPAPRGTILDRNGEALTRNIPIYKQLASLSDEQASNGQWKILTREEAEEVKQRGEEVTEDVGREYIYGEVVAHILGYVGEVSPEEILQTQNIELGLGDVVGKMGIEKTYEAVLRGTKGGEVVERLANGEVVRLLKMQKPQVGGDVKLTIDLGLQKKVVGVMQKTLLGKIGGVVIVSEPKSGEILALVSMPVFDPNVFSSQETHSINSGQVVNNDKRRAILDDKDKPMFNRAVGGVYPPGSIFKIVTATAGLEEGKIDAETQIEDTGEIKIGQYRYGNWYFDQYGRKEGFLDVVGALRRSNDIFFYKLGEKLGANRLASWAQKFGLGQEVDLGLGAEAKGLVPTPGWKDKEKGERWFLGNTYHMSIGQGDLMVTPLQAHQMMSVIAAEGKKCQPTIVSKAGPAKSCEDIGISQETLDLVKQGMLQVCKAGGTAFPFFDFSTKESSPSGEISDGDRVACKTGTAQFGAQGKTHAWFVAFGPLDPQGEPEIAITVLLEAAGEGSYEAAPVAREILDYWFHER